MKMRVAASVALTAAVATTLSACMFVTPQQTARSYTPSDGVNGAVGSVKIRNVFLVSDDGEDASLIGALSNTSDTVQSVTLQWDSSTGTTSRVVDVPAQGLVSLRPTSTTPVETGEPTQEQDVTLSGIEATPGGLYSVGFTTASADPVSLRLPVLDTSQQQYSTLAPTPTPTPTPTRTRRPAAGPTDSASPGSSETPEAADTAAPAESTSP